MYTCPLPASPAGCKLAWSPLSLFTAGSVPTPRAVLGVRADGWELDGRKAASPRSSCRILPSCPGSPCPRDRRRKESGGSASAHDLQYSFRDPAACTVRPHVPTPATSPLPPGGRQKEFPFRGARPQRLPRSACAQQLFLLAMVGLKWSRARA